MGLKDSFDSWADEISDDLREIQSLIFDIHMDLSAGVYRDSAKSQKRLDENEVNDAYAKCDILWDKCQRAFVTCYKTP